MNLIYEDRIVEFSHNLSNDDEYCLYDLSQEYQELIKDVYYDTNLTKESTLEYLSVLYRMIFHCRYEKKEYDNSYMLINVWFQHGFPELARKALTAFVYSENNYYTHTDYHLPYGRWEDLKYFCNYMKSVADEEGVAVTSYSIFNDAIDLMVNQLYADSTSTYPSLLCKWIPKEKSKTFGWLAYHISTKYYSEWMRTGNECGTYRKAIRKCLTYYRVLVSNINYTRQRLEYEDKKYDDEEYDGEAYDGEAYDGEAYDGEAYDGEAYDGEAYNDEDDGEAYDDNEYDGEAYDGEAYDEANNYVELLNKLTYNCYMWADKEISNINMWGVNKKNIPNYYKSPHYIDEDDDFNYDDMPELISCQEEEEEEEEEEAEEEEEEEEAEEEEEEEAEEEEEEEEAVAVTTEHKQHTSAAVASAAVASAAVTSAAVTSAAVTSAAEEEAEEEEEEEAEEVTAAEATEPARGWLSWLSWN
jgi:hypothetical protein